MKKKITWLAAGALCVVSLGIGAAASGIITSIQAELRPDFTITIDGEKQTFRNVNGDVVEPILYQGTTYLPVRAIGELMGKTVYWYEEEKRIDLKTEGTTVTDADVIVPGGTGTGGTGTTGGTVAAGGVTLEQAKEIALQKAGVPAADATFVKAKLDYDDGRQIYEIEFIANNTKYSADIVKSDGAIISWEVEGQGGQTASGVGISLEEAKEIALQKAGVSAADAIFTESKIEYEKGRQVYDIEFRVNRVEYTAEILASDGTVVSWEIDGDKTSLT